MNRPTKAYENLKEPPHFPEEDVSACHLFILAWDESGKRYAFGTNPHMLIDKNDAERFKTCDLCRYPIGDTEGFSNKVVVIQALHNNKPKRVGTDEALRIYDGAASLYTYNIVRKL